MGKTISGAHRITKNTDPHTDYPAPFEAGTRVQPALPIVHGPGWRRISFEKARYGKSSDDSPPSDLAYGLRNDRPCACVLVRRDRAHVPGVGKRSGTVQVYGADRRFSSRRGGRGR